MNTLLDLSKYVDKEFYLNTSLCHIAMKPEKIKNKIKGAPDKEVEAIQIMLSNGLTMGFIPKDEDQKKEFLSHFNII